MKTHLSKNQNGFTLVEVIISIAVLSLICGVVLKLFVLSNQVSEKVRIEDVASVYASNALEICKGVVSPKDILKDEFFAKAIVMNELGSDYAIYYDQKWKTSMDQASIYRLVLSMEPGDEGVSLSKDITNLSNEVTIKTTLYQLSVRVEQLDDTGDYQSIVTYQTSKYFVFEE